MKGLFWMKVAYCCMLFGPFVILVFYQPPKPLAPVRPAQNSPATVELAHTHLGKCPECARAFDQGLERKVKRLVDEEMKERFRVLGVGSKLPRVTK